MTLLRVEREGLSLLLNGPSVVVIVEPTSAPRFAPNVEELRNRYGLTNAEARVLRGPLRGKSLGEIAQDVGRSIETLRSQQKALFRKLEVHSQFELVTRIHRDCGSDRG